VATPAQTGIQAAVVAGGVLGSLLVLVIGLALLVLYR